MNKTLERAVPIRRAHRPENTQLASSRRLKVRRGFPSEGRAARLDRHSRNVVPGLRRVGNAQALHEPGDEPSAERISCSIQVDNLILVQKRGRRLGDLDS